MDEREFIEKIKDILKIDRDLEIYGRMDLSVLYNEILEEGKEIERLCSSEEY